jgi:hypothetical protein
LQHTYAVIARQMRCHKGLGVFVVGIELSCFVLHMSVSLASSVCKLLLSHLLHVELMLQLMHQAKLVCCVCSLADATPVQPTAVLPTAKACTANSSTANSKSMYRQQQYCHQHAAAAANSSVQLAIKRQSMSEW